MDLKKIIRHFPDFPETGILYYDISSILLNPLAFHYCVDTMLEYYHNQDFDGVACIESRGFLWASTFAYQRRLPLTLIRKPGKLPGQTISQSFNLEYGQDVLELRPQDIIPGSRFLLIDDLIATGGTLKTAVQLLEHCQAHVLSIFAIIGLPSILQSDFGSIDVKTLVDYP